MDENIEVPIMKNMISILTLFLIVGGFYSSVRAQERSDNKIVDHHTHIFSPEVRTYLVENVEKLDSLQPLGIEQLINTMDRDTVSKAVVLSNAYFFSDSGEVSEEEYQTFQAENDFIARAVSEYSNRIIGFFSINPLSDSAFVEIKRNASREEFAGIKLHLANSGVDLRNNEHVKRLANIFERANAYNLGIIIHLRTHGKGYGRKDARIFVDNILSEATDIPVQIAHMAGWSGYDVATDEALRVFADRISEGELNDNIYFDLSAVIKPVSKEKELANDRSKPDWYPHQRYERLVMRLRKIGTDRILFGTDWPDWTPANYKSIIRKKLPLDKSELQTIFTNRAPWLKQLASD